MSLVVLDVLLVVLLHVFHLGFPKELGKSGIVVSWSKPFERRLAMCIPMLRKDGNWVLNSLMASCLDVSKFFSNNGMSRKRESTSSMAFIALSPWVPTMVPKHNGELGAVWRERMV